MKSFIPLIALMITAFSFFSVRAQEVEPEAQQEVKADIPTQKQTSEREFTINKAQAFMVVVRNNTRDLVKSFQEKDLESSCFLLKYVSDLLTTGENMRTTINFDSDFYPESKTALLHTEEALYHTLAGVKEAIAPIKKSLESSCNE